MTVRAKFKFTRYETSLSWNDPTRELRTLHLSPVTGGSEENKKFYDATPAGEITLGTLNQEAWEQFELGREYYVDFTLAE